MPFAPGSYPAKVVADGATYYWRLNDPSGTTATEIIGGVNGTISGGVTLNQPGALSDGSKGMTFDGVNGKILTAAAVAIPLAVTVEGWLKFTASVQSPVLSNRGAGGLTYVGTSGGTLFFYKGGGGTGLIACNDNRWHHAVYVLSGSTISFYVDGVFDRSQTIGSPGAENVAVTFANDAAAFFNGSLDDVALYPSALTAAQVSAHYLAGKQSQSWPGVLWWIQIQGGDILDSFNIWQPITPSDTVDLPRGVSGGVWVGVGGDVAAVMGNNIMPVVLAAVPTGAWLPIAAKRINSTGTTASGLVALYEV